MYKLLIAIGVVALQFCGVRSVDATLTTIGTAQFEGKGVEYNLIWDDNNGNDQSVVWLDYSNAQTNWSNQTAWAAGLDENLTYNIYSAYSVTWDDAPWRLGSTVDGEYQWWYDGTSTAGYNIATSEIGHLFYEELENLAYYDTSASTQSGYGLQNTGDFEYLETSFPDSSYWSGTEYSLDSRFAWYFTLTHGTQDATRKDLNRYGLALRDAQVIAPIPEPATMLLFGTGLVGLVGYRLRKNKKSPFQR